MGKKKEDLLIIRSSYKRRSYIKKVKVYNCWIKKRKNGQRKATYLSQIRTTWSFYERKLEWETSRSRLIKDIDSKEKNVNNYELQLNTLDQEREDWFDEKTLNVMEDTKVTSHSGNWIIKQWFGQWWCFEWS